MFFKMKIGPLVRALIPAGILAALVLFVFSTLQYYGPESTVRRFHESIRNQDTAELRDLILPPKTPQQARAATYMTYLTQMILERSPVYGLRDVQREPRKVYVTVYYFTSNRVSTGNRTYVAVETSTGWKIDIQQTLAIWNSYFRPRELPNG